MSCVRPSVRWCTLSNRALRMALKEFLQHSKESRGVLGKANKHRERVFEGRKDGRKLLREPKREPKRELKRELKREQASTRKAFSRSHALEGLVFYLKTLII